MLKMVELKKRDDRKYITEFKEGDLLEINKEYHLYLGQCNESFFRGEHNCLCYSFNDGEICHLLPTVMARLVPAGSRFDMVVSQEATCKKAAINYAKIEKENLLSNLSEFDGIIKNPLALVANSYMNMLAYSPEFLHHNPERKQLHATLQAIRFLPDIIEALKKAREENKMLRSAQQSR